MKLWYSSVTHTIEGMVTMLMFYPFGYFKKKTFIASSIHHLNTCVICFRSWCQFCSTFLSVKTLNVWYIGRSFSMFGKLTESIVIILLYGCACLEFCSRYVIHTYVNVLHDEWLLSCTCTYTELIFNVICNALKFTSLTVIPYILMFSLEHPMLISCSYSYFNVCEIFLRDLFDKSSKYLYWTCDERPYAVSTFIC